MDYISAKEASEKWQVHIRVVQDYCKQGRIPQARKYGVSWMIPADVCKPHDLRKKAASASPYTLPRKCPELIFTTLYNTPGSGSSVAQSLYSDPQAQALFACQLAYFRGQTSGAKAAAQELLNRTDRTDVQLGCLFTLALCAMYEGDVPLWLNTSRLLEQLPCPAPEIEAQRDFQLANISSGLYDEKGFPGWLCDGCFDPLPIDCFPLARLIYLKYLLISKGNPGISPICIPFISQCRAEGALLAEIYCLILTAIGFHDRGDSEKAAELLDTAIKKALPDRLYSPFAEYRSEFGVLLDERLEAADKSALSAVRELHKRLLSGWGVLCREVRGVKYTDNLTQRERHAAKLAAKGLTNAEIAERMNVSINSVKRYISEIIGKTGAPNRDAIADYIALTGETVP